MHYNFLLRIITIISLTTLGSGCAVRTYTITKERVDQNLSEGNRGYMQGTAPAVDPNRSTTREISVVEVEIGKTRVPKKKAAAKTSAQKITTEASSKENNNEGVQTAETVSIEAKTTTYIVQKNDTLEKIAARPEIYGDAKKWYKIFKANESTLKSPNKIYPGQTIIIPRD